MRVHSTVSYCTSVAPFNSIYLTKVVVLCLFSGLEWWLALNVNLWTKAGGFSCFLGSGGKALYKAFMVSSHSIKSYRATFEILPLNVSVIFYPALACPPWSPSSLSSASGFVPNGLRASSNRSFIISEVISNLID